MVAEFAGSVPGPVSHVTLCELDAFDQVKVTTPAAAVSGVGLKELLLTVIELPWPPLLLPVESLQAASPTTASARTARRANFIKPPKVSTTKTRLSCDKFRNKRLPALTPGVARESDLYHKNQGDTTTCPVIPLVKLVE